MDLNEIKKNVERGIILENKKKEVEELEKKYHETVKQFFGSKTMIDKRNEMKTNLIQGFKDYFSRNDFQISNEGSYIVAKYKNTYVIKLEINDDSFIIFHIGKGPSDSWEYRITLKLMKEYQPKHLVNITAGSESDMLTKQKKLIEEDIQAYEKCLKDVSNFTYVYEDERTNECFNNFIDFLNVKFKK